MEDLDKKLFETVKSIVLNESVEQIDEISKKTLGSYVNKAHKDLENKSWEYVKKYSPNNGATKDSSNDMKKIQKRRSGIEKASWKLVKEDAESLDEISKKTLGSYIKKATNNLDKNSWDSGYHARYPSELSPDSRDAELRISQKAIGKSAKRVKGIAKATDKLTKEDIDHINENLEIYTHNDVMAILENVLEDIFADDTE